LARPVEVIREAHFNLAMMMLLAGVPVYGLLADDPYLITLATKIAILGLAGTGLNVALGYGGLISFGHAAFFGIGGYVVGILASPALNYTPLMTWPVEIPGTTQMLVIWLLAVLASGLAALAIGLLSLRTGGVYFIMITLAFAQMIYYFAISWPAYGGEDGLPIYVRNAFPGLNTMNPMSFFAICFGLLMAVLALVSRIANAPFGFALQAARQNAQRVTSAGINTLHLRLAAFVISGMITGLAGALYADLNRFVSPSMLSWHTSGQIMVFVILGGAGRLFGPVAGAALFILLEQVLGGFTEFWQFWLGLILIFVVLFARGGITGALTGSRSARP
jgi:branched-chain amino acid transport system permease protein